MLLRSKLFAPPIRQEFIPRSALVCQLDQLKGGDIALVEAPAGYGKSTLVSQWGQQKGVTFSWLTLDEGDNHPHQFADYFAAALQKLSGKPDSLAMERSASNVPLLTRISWLLNQFDMDIGDQHSDQPYILALDDVHKIYNQQVVDGINLILDYLPSNLAVVMTSRNELSHLQWPRRRIRQKVIEIDFQGLSLSEQETAQLLNQSLHLSLSKECIHSLQEKTEGWISGIHLSALSLSKTKDKKTFVHNFSGNNRLVEEYLVGEVLTSLSDKQQTFLLLTSYLDKFSPALINEVLNRTDSELQLKELEKQNSFLVPLDDEREWFRYHDLFADLLQKECKKRFPDHETQLYVRAASWLERNEYLKEACHYWIESHHWLQVVAFLEKHGASFVRLGNLTQIQEWINQIPLEIQNRSAQLILFKIESLSDSEKSVFGESLLNQAEQLLNSGDFDANENSKFELLVEIYLQRAFLARLVGDLNAASQASRKALNIAQSKGLPKCAHGFRGLGEDHYMRGDMVLAQEALQQAIEYGKQEREIYGVMLSNNYLVAVLSAQGLLRQAIEQSEAVEEWLLQQGVDLRYIHFRINISLVDVFRELNELERAANVFIQPFDVLKKVPASLEKMYVYLSYARVLNSQGRLGEAIEALDTAAFCKRSVNTDWNFGWASAEALKAKSYLRAGQLDMAAHWLKEMDPDILKCTTYAAEEERIIAAHIMGLQGNSEKAFAILESVEKAAKEGNRMPRVVLACLVQSILSGKDGDMTAAKKQLIKALEMAAPFGLVRVFLDLGQDLLSLLKQVTVPDALQTYLDSLFKAAEQDPWLSQQQTSLESEISLLSKRERKILMLLGEGLKDKEIAEDLHIALSTVKTHTRNIYQKLGVANRTRAVALARGKKLIN